MSDYEIIMDKENIFEIKVLNTLTREEREKLARLLKVSTVMRRKFNGIVEYYSGRSVFTEVDYIDYCACDDEPYVVTFYVDGMSFGFLLSNFRPIKNHIYYLYSKTLEGEVIFNMKFKIFNSGFGEDVRMERIVGINGSTSLLNEIDICLDFFTGAFVGKRLFFSFGFTVPDDGVLGDRSYDIEEKEYNYPPQLTYLTNRECMICNNDKSCVLFASCGHIPICAGCDRKNRCPFCGKVNNLKFKIDFGEGN